MSTEKTTEQSAQELEPCPMCGAGETRVDEQKFWTGMRSDTVSVTVRHWCAGDGKLPRRTIEVTGRDRAEAIATWNTRAALAAAKGKA